MIKDRLKKQLEFMIELDKMKNLYRQTYVLHEDRKENDAEHSWHIALMAFLLEEYADSTVNTLKVMKMLLI
ncbi:MAG: HD domain-containing protein, partial [Ruminococcus sp.]|nr:HD domain-containing protein [Ruminococcus sp.]